jgi:hypothetical protein
LFIVHFHELPGPTKLFLSLCLCCLILVTGVPLALAATGAAFLTGVAVVEFLVAGAAGGAAGAAGGTGAAGATGAAGFAVAEFNFVIALFVLAAGL